MCLLIYHSAVCTTFQREHKTMRAKIHDQYMQVPLMDFASPKCFYKMLHVHMLTSVVKSLA
jgi:hypothetical protein